MTMTTGNGSRLTPGEVQSIRFPMSRLGRRGLDEDQVRAFCVRVHEELTRLLTENASLYEETQRLRKRVVGSASNAAAGYTPDDAHVQAVRILSGAQRTADRYVADAQAYSREMAEDARRRRDEILAEAKTRATMLLEEAHTTASRAAADVSASMSPATASERRELEAEIAYLRTFSDVYRTHLRAYLEALVRNVDEWECAEKSKLAQVKLGHEAAAIAHP
jgi:DivIVA domain-containing protein